MENKNTPLTLRRITVIAYDWFSIVVALVLSFLVRFDFSPSPFYRDQLIYSLPWIFCTHAIILAAFGLYRGLWAFASIPDLVLILKAVGATLLANVGMIYFLQSDSTLFPHAREIYQGWPKSVYLIDAILLGLFLGGGRFAYRYFRDYVYYKKSAVAKRVLIIGVGRTGTLIAKELQTHRTNRTHVIGFVDDDRKYQNGRVLGIPVRGTIAEIDLVLSRTKPDEVVIAIPLLKGDRVKAIFSAALTHGAACRILPPITDVLSGTSALQQLRAVNVDDLLRRDPVEVDQVAVNHFFEGRTILITGAGGSIGSELCRQVLRFKPKKLVLFDHSEFNLYLMHQELQKSAASLPISYVLGDVLNTEKLRALFSDHQPDVVLHAAAYKHVPLIEENPEAALKNNVLGTFNIALEASKHQVKEFVMVSTDKAVRPTSIMGASKRMAEMVIENLRSQTSMKIMAVRFGNVLDSRGSVLPLFREQITKGGPVTVTHPEMTRYFMTIPEAALLVLQAAAMGKGGEVFLLDMGEPVLISTLAEDLISLSGLRPHKDIQIQYTGLRSGEKLYEELLTDPSHATRTAHPKVWIAENELSGALQENWMQQVQSFQNRTMTRPEVVQIVESWVKDYQPSANA